MNDQLLGALLQQGIKSEDELRAAIRTEKPVDISLMTGFPENVQVRQAS